MQIKRLKNNELLPMVLTDATAKTSQTNFAVLKTSKRFKQEQTS